jgi:hypothetical protein
MSQISRKASWCIVGAALCFVPSVFADCSYTSTTPTVAGTACMSLTGAGSNIMGNVYVGPYTAYINGSGTPTSVICDDFKDDSYLPEYWTADIFSGSAVTPTSNTRMEQVVNGQFAAQGIPAITGAALTEAYNEVGYLATQLLSAPDATTAAEIHYALWNVFDPNALSYLSSFYSADPNHTFYNAALGQYNAALAYKDKPDFISQFNIYSPDTNYSITCSPAGASCYTKPPQEFLVKTPEPPFLALLGVDLSGVGALFLLFRRRRYDRS